MSAEATITHARPISLPLVSMASVALGFLTLQLVAFLQAGVFEYPLDDVYIHLAVAEQIAAGGYGVNAGEVAAAASSPVYPLLLVPFAGSDWQRYVPLFWNSAALLMCGWLWGRILEQAGIDRTPRAVALFWAAAVPLLINLAGIGFVGMEHCLHTATSLAVVLGLLRLLDEDEISPWLIAGIILGPALRFEALALSLLAAAVLVLRRRYLAGLLSGAAALGVIALFMGFLVSIGLDPLPTSVQAKLGDDTYSNSLAGVIAFIITTLSFPNFWILVAAFASAAIMPRFVPGLVQSPRRWLLFTILLALAAHMFIGKVGWMNRYENYILVASVAALAALGAGSGRQARLLALVPVVAATLVYAPHYLNHYPVATRTIDRQQAQMSRFAKVFHGDSVAVNDLGWVAWQNPDYVLDIWGLGSKEALDLRRDGGPERWVGELADRHEVDLAMIFDEWFRANIGEDWVRLGQLELIGRRGYTAQSDVAFYATSAEAAPTLRRELAGWEKGLPDGARFTFDPEEGK